jgi:hypothetical protein
MRRYYLLIEGNDRRLMQRSTLAASAEAASDRVRGEIPVTSRIVAVSEYPHPDWDEITA